MSVRDTETCDRAINKITLIHINYNEFCSILTYQIKPKNAK